MSKSITTKAEELIQHLVEPLEDENKRLSIQGRRLLTEREVLKRRVIELTVHLGNMLDEIVTTRRNDYTGDLHCDICDCNVSRNKPHTSDCNIGKAHATFDKEFK